MRSISVAGLAKLRTRCGIEPVCIVEIDWVSGGTTSYSDKTVTGIQGKILEIGDLDDVVSLNGSSVRDITLKLDDTDGSIRAILDGNDVHKRPARVYQYFSDLNLSDKFLLFDGDITTPVVWNERDRTVTLSIVSQLENQECGYTTDMYLGGVLPSTVPNDAWPMVFGTVENNKAVQIIPPVTGTTMSAIGVLGGLEALLEAPDDPGIDFQLSVAMSAMYIDWEEVLYLRFYDAYVRASSSAAKASYLQAANAHAAAKRAKSIEVVNKIADFQAQQQLTKNKRLALIAEAKLHGYGDNPVQILNGENFPQGHVTVNISGAIFTGTMTGNWLTIDSRSSDYLDELAAGILDNANNGLTVYGDPVTYTKLVDGVISSYGCTMAIKYGGNTFQATGDYETITILDRPSTTVKGTWFRSEQVPNLNLLDGSSTVTLNSSKAYITVTDKLETHYYDSILQHLWIEAGSSVQVWGQESLQYVASITPGTVTAVKAVRTVAGVSLLVDVPSYTVEEITVNTELGVELTATVVKLPQLMSTILNEHWSSDIYVTFVSEVGPKIPEILTWIIETFSDLAVDTNFSGCGVPFLANFAINSSQNVLSVLQSIAFQACCQIRIVNKVVYLTYLPQSPNAIETIAEGDILADNGVTVSYTPTEDLVTKMRVQWSELPCPTLETVIEKTWDGSAYLNKAVSGNDAGELKHPSYSEILRANIGKYGVRDNTYTFNIFNDRATVLLCANFWLRRKSNTWKRVSFTTPLHKLNVETGDAISLSFLNPFVASTSITAIVESASYDSLNNCIKFECIAPVLAGTMATSLLYWGI